MKELELIIDESYDICGVSAISLVNDPAIEANFIAFSKQYEVKLSIDNEKKIVMGPALIPNKLIPRLINNEIVNVYFSASTIKKTSELFLMNSYQNNSTLEHKKNNDDIFTVESWIKEDEVHDKSVKFGMDYPVGTWFIAQKINNEDVWNNYVKTGKVKGFSIEGFFADRAIENSKQSEEEEIILEIKKILSGI